MLLVYKKIMNNVDKISRDSKILIDSAKDTVSANVVSMVKSNALNLEPAQLEKILSVINISLDEGYQKALPYYQNSIKKYF